MGSADDIERVERLVDALVRRTAAEARGAGVPGEMGERERQVVEALRGRDPMRMGTLAEATGLPFSTVTGIVERLVRARLVRRDRPKSDRRGVEVRLLPRGEQWAAGARRRHRETVRAMLDVLSESEREALAALADRILRAWEADSGRTLL